MPKLHTESRKAKKIPLQQFEKEEGEKRASTVTIHKSAETIYNFFRDPTNLRYFMKGVLEVRPVSATVWHWIVEDDKDSVLEWDSEIVVEKRHTLIAWQRLGEGEFQEFGVLRLEALPNKRGTKVSLRVSDDNEDYVLTNLKRLKAYLETGEVPTIKGQPNGKEEHLTH